MERYFSFPLHFSSPISSGYLKNNDCCVISVLYTSKRTKTLKMQTAQKSGATKYELKQRVIKNKCQVKQVTCAIICIRSSFVVHLEATWQTYGPRLS